MALLFLALLVLVVPGMIYNNLNNSGVVVAQTLTCGGPYSSGQLVDPTCQGSVNAGCQVSSAYCGLSGRTVSFLNINSPFTQLINGNIFGLFSSLTSSGSTAPTNNNPFQNTGAVPYIYADCYVIPNGAGGLRQWSIGRCTQTDIDNGNLTAANTIRWLNWNPTQNGTAASYYHFYNTQNGTFPQSCSWDVQINYTATAGNGWTYYGCTLSSGNQIITHKEWTFMVAVSNANHVITAGHKFVYVQPENWYTQGCSNNGLSGNLHTDQCDAWARSFLGFTIPGTSTQFVPGGGGAIMAFLIGIFLFLMGLGLNFTTSGSVFASGGGAGAGVNEQGTRLAQTLGIGLIVWAPLYSQFATWFTTGLLPYGLDGAAGITSVVLTGMFFFGVFWVVMSQND